MSNSVTYTFTTVWDDQLNDDHITFLWWSHDKYRNWEVLFGAFTPSGKNVTIDPSYKY